VYVGGTAGPITLVYVPANAETKGAADPVWVNEEPEYEIEEICIHRYEKSLRSTEYLVRWKGYDMSEATWEEESELQETEALEVYKNDLMGQNQKKRKASRQLRRQ
jgi:hypothetical protein